MKLFSTNIGKELFVVVGNCDRESRFGYFFTKHMLVDLEVGAVGGETVGNARHAVDDESGSGRVVSEMGVDVGDSIALHVVGGVNGFGEYGERTGEVVGAAEVCANDCEQGTYVI